MEQIFVQALKFLLLRSNAQPKSLLKLKIVSDSE